jgi:hypothetical protein
MSVIKVLKNRLLTRPFIIALSIAALAVFGFWLNLRLPAILLSALLFAGGYLLESTGGRR